MANEPPEIPEFIKQANREAEQAFYVEGIKRMPSARMANRFHIQMDRGSGYLMIGSIGVTGSFDGDKQEFSAHPHWRIDEVYRVERDFLENLQKILADLLTGSEDG